MSMKEEITDDSYVGKEEETKRLRRILQIVAWISNSPRRWTRRRLSEQLEISERQIDKDLHILRHGMLFGIARVKEGYYFTRVPDLPPVRFTAPEALTLLTALQLARGTGSIEQASLAAALARIEDALPGTFLDLVRDLRNLGDPMSPQQQHRAATLRIVQAAFAARRCLRIHYESAIGAGTVRERTICVYHMQPHEHSWLITAHDSFHEEVLDFRVDRIHTASLSEETYAIPPGFDIAAYRGSGWGVVRGENGPDEDIVLRFTAEEGRRARDEGHRVGRYEDIQPDGSVIFRYHAAVTPDFLRWLLMRGTGCVVLARASLRQAVAARARQIAAQYEEATEEDGLSHFSRDGGNEE